MGKSALFNRIVGRRVAIVHAQSGVTRDRVTAPAEWDGWPLTLIDTGGLDTTDRPGCDVTAGIRRQVEAALKEAAAVILVVDGEAGLHPLDEEVARFLRRRACPAVVAVNKADLPDRDTASADFARLGLPTFPVSALHNRGMEPLMGAVLERLPPVEAESATPPTAAASAAPLRVAVVGRPNVGKSSFVNRLLCDERVLVSDVPGTTRDSIEIPFSTGEGDTRREYVLVDTAGMRRRHKIDNSVERFSLFRAEKSVEHADVVLLLVDAARGPTAQDKKIGALVAEKGRGCVVVVNKWDLAQGVKRRDYEPALREAMPFLSHCPVVFLSARTGHNLHRAVQAIDHVAAQVTAVLPTGILNRTILDAVQRVSPPTVEGRRLRIYYATQTGTSPLVVRLFVNHPKRLTPAYREYLVRSLRERFGLEGAPVFLQLRAHRAEGGKE